MKLDPKIVAEAKGVMLAHLRAYGINDTITVKVKKIPNARWIGMYRGGSQFRSNPIFWVNEDLPATAKRTKESLDEKYGYSNQTLDAFIFEAVVTTLEHEYGHVIYEWASKTNPRLLQTIFKYYGDEENFAEEFMREISYPSPQMKSIVDMFRESAFKKR